MTDSQGVANEIAHQLHAGLTQSDGLDAGLDAVLNATKARATGLWRVESGYLRLLGFRAVSDMPADVQSGFAAATSPSIS